MSGFSASGIKGHQEKPDRTKVQSPSVQQAKEGFDLAVVQCIRSYIDASLLTQDPVKKRVVTLFTFQQCGLFGFLVHNRTARIELEESIGYEAVLTQAVEEYDFRVDGPVQKETGIKSDVFRGSNHLPLLLLRFGALRSYETWFQKTLQAFQELGPFTDYVSEFTEVYYAALANGAPTIVLCGFEDDAGRILAATGLAEWTDTGMDALWTNLAAGFPFRKSHTHMRARQIKYF